MDKLRRGTKTPTEFLSTPYQVPPNLLSGCINKAYKNHAKSIRQMTLYLRASPPNSSKTPTKLLQRLFNEA